MRFHFTLGHLQDSASLQVELRGKPFSLSAHTETSWAAARKSHPVLSLVTEEITKTYSHFTDIPHEHLDNNAMHWVRVVRPLRPGSHLQEVVLIAQVVPPDRLLAFYNSPIWKERHTRKYGDHLTPALRATAATRVPHHNGRLQALGINPDPSDNAQAVNRLMALQELVDEHTTAVGLMAHHPELASTQHATAAYVRDSVIPGDGDMDQANALEILKSEIKKTQSWSPVVDCKDYLGNPILAEYDLGKGKNKISKGQQMQTYSVADNVKSAAAPAIGGAMRLASDNMQLKNQLWKPTLGKSAVKSAGQKANNSKAAKPLGTTQYKWTVPYQTWSDGIRLDKNITVDDKGKVSIDCYNIYSRTLYVAYDLFDASGKSLGGREPWGSVPAVDNIMGIPIPVVPTTITFDMESAASFKLYIGSAGVWNRDHVSYEQINVSDRGALLTLAWQYTVPGFMLAFNAIMFNTKRFKEIVSAAPEAAAAIKLLMQLCGPFTGIQNMMAASNWKHFLIRMGSIAASFLTQLAMKPVLDFLVQDIEENLEEDIMFGLGGVGWIFELAAASITIAQMLITTGEIFASDALMVAEIKRAIDVKLTLLPDPKHGEAGNPQSAVWPAVATHYVATLTIQCGTGQEKKGDLPSTTKGTPIPITFENIPAGGNFRIFVGLYSENGWLAGSWQNDWTAANPNDGTTLDLKDKHITEQLVPLSFDTQYAYKEKIAYDGSNFSWTAQGSPPATTMRSLNCDPQGGLCELSALTINNSVFQVGLAWRAAKQHLHPDSITAPLSDNQLYSVQNLSVLEQPGARLKTTQIGFTQKPGIAYSPYVNSNDTINQSNFILDPRSELPSKGVLHLRQVVLSTDQPDDKHDFGLGDTPLLSWGYFPLDHLDAVAVHPGNAVVACSFTNHKLMILDLPDEASTDATARVARMVSGQGTREGLMKGPKALVVAPDGRILVLESLNNRVQSFDVKGSAVPSFVHPSSLTLKKADVAAALDAGKIPAAFVDGLIQQELTYVAPLPDSSYIRQLDTALFQPKDDPLIAALATLQIYLAYEPTDMRNPKLSAQIQVVQAGKSWIITDPRQHGWQILHKDDSLVVYERPVEVEVEVQKPGARWLLTDRYLNRAWMLKTATRDGALVDVFRCLTYFRLKPGPEGKPLNYLDMAVESQGYMYVLSSINDGSATTDYLLDVYDPEGTFLFRSPDASKTTKPQNIVAGRIAVSIFRDLYALNYETLSGPGGRVQPGLAHWIPTPPLFSLPLTEQANFNAPNISAVTQDFEAHKKLSAQAFIKVINPEGYWQVHDGNTIYHVYRSSEGLQVYSTPA